MCSLEIKYLFFQDSDSLLAGTKIHVGFSKRLEEIRIEPWCNLNLVACAFRSHLEDANLPNVSSTPIEEGFRIRIWAP